MAAFGLGRFRVRLAEGEGDIRRCQELRYLAFFAARGLGGGRGLDADEFDAACRHVMVEEAADGRLVCCFRMLPFDDGSTVGQSYSARHYRLSRLRSFPGRMVEMGRFCIRPGHRDPAIIRAAWRAMARHVEEQGVELLFGCSSFDGADVEAHRDALALLAARHLAPARWQPRVKAPQVFRFARALGSLEPDPKLAMAGMPPLLRTYLAMGGWVSDHAVIDTRLDTLHVFTGVEVSGIPRRHVEFLRAGRDAFPAPAGAAMTAGT